jgi:hypothetical protein
MDRGAFSFAGLVPGAAPRTPAPACEMEEGAHSPFPLYDTSNLSQRLDSLARRLPKARLTPGSPSSPQKMPLPAAWPQPSPLSRDGSTVTALSLQRFSSSDTDPDSAYALSQDPYSRNESADLDFGLQREESCSALPPAAEHESDTIMMEADEAHDDEAVALQNEVC